MAMMLKPSLQVSKDFPPCVHSQQLEQGWDDVCSEALWSGSFPQPKSMTMSGMPAEAFGEPQNRS